jgi:heme/copper-type cytochrome/quinol oxidase subunit 3
MYWDWHYFLVPFTNWTLIMTTLLLSSTILACIDDKAFKQDKRAMAANHLLYTFSMIMNIVVMTVYWTLLHKE